MVDPAQAILASLQEVATERARRTASPDLAARVKALKAYQQRRFERTHADLLADRRHGPAARFFLDDLYGPQDFAERDAQFARIVPALVRLFPPAIVATVAQLAALHALSERLDTQMAQALPTPQISRLDYVLAWQATGQPELRQQQLQRVLALGEQLDQFTRHRWLRHSLGLMRGPARAAGLGTLQAFLERGFDTFAQMGGGGHLLQCLRERESALMRRLFEPEAVALATSSALGVTEAIGQLP